MIVGIDEVGRGCWAGPLLVVAAKAKFELPAGLADSKLLSAKKRQELCEAIVQCCHLGEGWVQPEEIDNIGLGRALRLGVARSLMALGALIDDEIIIDGLVNYCPVEFTKAKAVVKADANHPVVSAASIYAKVTRDQYMQRISSFYPEYKFENHVGYGTKLHRQLLEKHGVSRIHRRSFRPIKTLMTGATLT